MTVAAIITFPKEPVITGLIHDSELPGVKGYLSMTETIGAAIEETFYSDLQSPSVLKSVDLHPRPQVY